MSAEGSKQAIASDMHAANEVFCKAGTRRSRAHVIAGEDQLGRLSGSAVGRVRVRQLLAQAPDLCSSHLVRKGQVNDDALPAFKGPPQLLLPLLLALFPGLHQQGKTT